MSNGERRRAGEECERQYDPLQASACRASGVNKGLDAAGRDRSRLGLGPTVHRLPTRVRDGRHSMFTEG